MNEIKVFNYNSSEVRTLQREGEPWFVLKDVCEVFGETNYRRVSSRLEDDEKGVSQIATPGGNQNMTVINEAGLYSTLFMMQPEKARGVSDEYIAERQAQLKAFRRWVTHEVLPSIRKHGAYMTSETLEKALEDPDTIIRLAMSLKAEKAQRKALEAELDRSKEWYSIKRVARKNGVSHKVFDWRRLKEASEAMEYEVRKIFDANYGEVNVYHQDVWEAVYPSYEL